MKYYLINYRYRKSKGVINFGDNLQTLALESLLSSFGVRDSSIGYIVRDDMGLDFVTREPGVFIPATGGMAWNSYPDTRDFPINERNLSVLYFGIRIPEGSMDVIRTSREFVASLQRHEPIGCRDVATRDFVRSLGVRAFFSKCVTLSFKRRPSLEWDYPAPPPPRHAYLFKEGDGALSDALKAALPAQLWNSHKELPVIMDSPAGRVMSDDDCFLVNKLAAERLELLRRDASLVVSRRIHIAIPCAAMGIPVLFIDHFPNDSRTQVARYLLPRHTASVDRLQDFNLIELTAPDFSSYKREMRLLFGLCLEAAEQRLGTSSDYLTNEERSCATKLLEKRCSEEYPCNSYLPISHSTETLIETLFGVRFHSLRVELSRRQLVIFGAGEFGGRIRAILGQAAIPVACFIDNAVENDTTTQKMGLSIISFEALCRDHKDSLVILAAPGYQEEMLRQLIDNGFNQRLIINTQSFCQKYIEFIPPALNSFNQ